MGLRVWLATYSAQWAVCLLFSFQTKEENFKRLQNTFYDIFWTHTWDQSWFFGGVVVVLMTLEKLEKLVWKTFTMPTVWESTKHHSFSILAPLRHPDRWYKCCHNLAFLAHNQHILGLSNEVLYDPVPQKVSKIWQVKFETSKFSLKKIKFQLWLVISLILLVV